MYIADELINLMRIDNVNVLSMYSDNELISPVMIDNINVLCKQYSDDELINLTMMSDNINVLCTVTMR